MVIQQLPNPLRDAICVFYLVLRGLDTVEDDMNIPNSTKLPALLSFHEKIYQRWGVANLQQCMLKSPNQHPAAALKVSEACAHQKSTVSIHHACTPRMQNALAFSAGISPWTAATPAAAASTTGSSWPSFPVWSMCSWG